LGRFLIINQNVEKNKKKENILLALNSLSLYTLAQNLTKKGKTMKLTLSLLFVASLFQGERIVLTTQDKADLRSKVRTLAEFDIRYGQNWTPPGEDKPIRMDCSATTQYLYRSVLGITIPRTSFDQYLAVQNAGNFVTPPKDSDGKIDSVALRSMLKTGDLLFWTNTHSDIPKERNPPIGHVMVYLGRTKAGVMKAGGANTFGRGEKVLRGGVDVFTFDPNMRIGCVKDKKGQCLVNSEFIGFGRPRK
jgi:hypothetical protein